MDGEKDIKLKGDQRLGVSEAYENDVSLLDEESNNNKQDQVAAQLMEFIAEKSDRAVRASLQVPLLTPGNFHLCFIY